MNVIQVSRAARAIDAAHNGATVRAVIGGDLRGPGTARGLTDAEGYSFRGDDVRDAYLRVSVGIGDQYWSLRDLIDGDPGMNALVIQSK